jgi:hypothetical protein
MDTCTMHARGTFEETLADHIMTQISIPRYSRNGTVSDLSESLKGTGFDINEDREGGTRPECGTNLGSNRRFDERGRGKSYSFEIAWTIDWELYC